MAACAKRASQSRRRHCARAAPAGARHCTYQTAPGPPFQRQLRHQGYAALMPRPAAGPHPQWHQAGQRDAGAWCTTAFVSPRPRAPARVQHCWAAGYNSAHKQAPAARQHQVSLQGGGREWVWCTLQRRWYPNPFANEVCQLCTHILDALGTTYHQAQQEERCWHHHAAEVLLMFCLRQA